MICPPRRRPRLALALAALALLPLAAPSAHAEDPPALYTLTDTGRLALWGTALDRLPSAGVVDWSSLLAVGADRFALRRDGQIARNGERLEKLPTPVAEDDAWILLESRDEDLLALSSRGLIARLGVDGEVVFADLPSGPFLFTDMLASRDAPFLVLRSDGLLIGPELLPVGLLTGGPAFDGSFDGLAPHTTWVRLAWDGSRELVLALRSDGLLVSFGPSELLDPEADPGTPEPFVSPVFGSPGPSLQLPDVGTLVAELPFGDSALQRNATYLDLELDGSCAEPGDACAWLVMRRDGAVFDPENTTKPALSALGSPFFGLPPAVDPLGIETRRGNAFVDLALFDGTIWRMRSLGQLYMGDPTSPIARIPGSGHVGLATSEQAADLTGLDNRRPVLAVYKVKAVEGESIDVPIVVSDVDQPLEERALDFDFSDVPGASYDPMSGTVNLPGTLPVGKHRFKVSVDDGSGDKPVRKTFPVRVRPVRAKGEKNARPLVSAIREVQALTGLELSLPIVATDRNGDELNIRPREGGVFDLGATFDPLRNTLNWTPGCEDVGPRRAAFMIDDGKARRRLVVSILVQFPLAPITKDD